jgi:hypothetical protein
MKKQIIGLFLVAATLVSNGAAAQKIRLAEGDLSPLAGEKELNVEFDYKDMKVGKMTETEYVNKKRDEYNKKEAGKGDNWVKAWEDDRETRFEPKFLQSFNQFSGGMTAGPLASAKYTMLVKTTFTEPGYNIVVHRVNAQINLDATIVETANRSKVVAKITVEKSPGGAWFDNDFDTGQRITEAYNNAGMSLAGFIRSKAH